MKHRMPHPLTFKEAEREIARRDKELERMTERLADTTESAARLKGELEVTRAELDEHKQRYTALTPEHRT